MVNQISGVKMPIKCYVDNMKEIVFAAGTGILTAEDVRTQRRRIIDDPEFQPYYDLLIDLSGVTEFQISSAEMRVISIEQIFNKRTRRAYVVPTEAAYGMLRMHTILSDAEPDEMQVFRDIAEARSWLGLD